MHLFRCLSAIQRLSHCVLHPLTGDWKTFTQQMGGVFSSRQSQVFKPYYELSVDCETGSQYCENECVRALKGVISAGREMITRIYQWRIESQRCGVF